MSEFSLALTDGTRWLDDPVPVASYDDAVAKAGARYQVRREQMNFATVFADGTLVFVVSRHLPGRWHGEYAPRQEPLKQSVQVLARALGFALFGVTKPQLPARYTQRFSEWLQSGAAADMDFVRRHAAERLDPEKILPGAQSVLVFGTPYAREAGGGADAKIARYATARDYHQVIPPRLSIIRRFILGHGGECYLSADTGPVLERAYAEQAGLGWIGKNGNLISRRLGSYVLLGTLWTTLALEPDAPHADFCGECSACLTGCPTSAITAPGLVDARRCIAYWNIEHRGPFPKEAPALSGWLFGCDICQEVCPWNRFASGAEIGQLAEQRPWPQSAEQWRSASDETLVQLQRGSPLRRVGSEGLKRNAGKT